ncbi:AI-2E family transporter [Candidimonas humi]|uniref:AI-2E family transporter n=1 Tax=Candidimonas humi TaxID=683355 RepID=A0ABV8NTW4_9BURK|nr:AI-2E family transporter [Candidimonas humi]MBV6303401.1 AI-2E family transporter [Candidimonas humi]
MRLPLEGPGGTIWPAAYLCWIAALLTLGLMYLASAVLVPLAFALFILALVAPLERALRRALGGMAAGILTLVITIGVAILFLSLAAWGLTVVAQWTIANSARLQRLFNIELADLDPRFTLVLTLFQDGFNVTWVLRALQELLVRINSTAGLIFLSFLFVTLGVFELDEVPSRIRRITRHPDHWADVTEQISAKLRRYMLIRTVASLLTGLTVWLFAMYAGLELATAWGALAFLLNYIPFLGPLLATLFPSFFAFVQFGSLNAAVIVLLILNVIQIAYGCYLEPRLAGSAFSLSPLAVMVAVFFWGLVWGIPGTFIGVPILIAATSIWTSQGLQRSHDPGAVDPGSPNREDPKAGSSLM